MRKRDTIAVLLAAFIVNCLEETGLALSLAVIQVFPFSRSIAGGKAFRWLR